MLSSQAQAQVLVLCHHFLQQLLHDINFASSFQVTQTSPFVYLPFPQPLLKVLVLHKSNLNDDFTHLGPPKLILPHEKKKKSCPTMKLNKATKTLNSPEFSTKLKYAFETETPSVAQIVLHLKTILPHHPECYDRHMAPSLTSLFTIQCLYTRHHR